MPEYNSFASIGRHHDIEETVHDVFVRDLDSVLSEIRELLIEKNRKYGDSALNPNRIMSKSSPTEQILVRMDDKLNRIMNSQADDTEDSFKDLMGYLILYTIAKKREK